MPFLQGAAAFARAMLRAITLDRLETGEDLHHVPTLDVPVGIQPSTSSWHDEPTRRQDSRLAQVLLRPPRDPLTTLNLRQQIVLGAERILSA
ncbi:hypothetical protein D9M68_693200 [compost metagenome]